jgi:hypothetical protein
MPLSCSTRYGEKMGRHRTPGHGGRQLRDVCNPLAATDAALSTRIFGERESFAYWPLVFRALVDS